MANLISIVVFLPLVAALILAFFLKGDDAAARRNAKWLALIATSATFLVAVPALRFRSGQSRFPVRGGAGVAAGPDLQDGGGRHLDPVRDAHHLPDAAGDRRLLGREGAGEGIHGRLPGAGDADARRLYRAGSGVVLSVLRGRADPDVPDHRDLGRQ